MKIIIDISEETDEAEEICPIGLWICRHPFKVEKAV